LAYAIAHRWARPAANSGMIGAATLLRANQTLKAGPTTLVVGLVEKLHLETSG
jgi:hypothetical protein